MARSSLYLLLLSLLVGEVSAQVAISIRAGTLGPGVGLTFPVADKLDLRLGGSYLPLTVEYDLSQDDIDVGLTSDVTIGAAQALIDWHPFGNWFRMTTGVYYNLIEANGAGTPTGPYTLNDKEFSPDKLGTLAAGMTYSNKVNPYVGIGFGDPVGNSRVTLLLDIGALYMGPPRFNLEATGMLTPTANEDQEAELNAGFESFKWLPNVSLGFAIRL